MYPFKINLVSNVAKLLSTEVSIENMLDSN